MGGLTLVPGVYCFTSSAGLTGTALTLDGGADDVWVFKIGSTLITGPGSTVEFADGSGGQSCNVFWRVGSSATLDTTTTFKGNILAQESISLENGATVEGRLLARTAAVTLINNTAEAVTCAVEPTPTTVPNTPVPNTPVPNTPVPNTPTPTPSAEPTVPPIIGVPPTGGSAPQSGVNPWVIAITALVMTTLGVATVHALRKRSLARI